MIYHIYDESPSERFAALLDMVARKAPAYMKSGTLISLSRESRILTDKERQKIVALRKQGRTQAAIASEIGCTPQLVSTICLREFGTNRTNPRAGRPLVHIDKEKAFALRAAGHAWEDVAIKLGVTRQLLCKRRREWAEADGKRVVRVEKAA